jgi:hypothetical protein
MKRAIVLTLALVLGIATTASAAPRFTRIEASHNSSFGSLLVGVTEEGLLPGTRVRIVISAAERFKYQCWYSGGPIDEEKYFIHDHLAIDFLEEANDQGQYRATFDVGPIFARGVNLDRCEGDAYPNLLATCYSFITVLDIHREIGITYPDRVCGKVAG